MRNLSRYSWNNKYEVRFLQGALNLMNDAKLAVDGSYGRLTEAAVKAFQKKSDLYETGKADNITLQFLGFRSTKNKNIVMFEVLFKDIERVDVIATEYHGSDVRTFANNGGYDIVWNGGFFRTSDYKMSNLIVQDGRVKHWGMSHSGIAYSKYPFKTALGSSYDMIAGCHYDMQGGAPVLISNFSKDEEEFRKFVNASSANRSIYYNKTRRCCTAITRKSIILAFSILECSCVDMTEEGLNQGDIVCMQNNDGGGSQSVCIGGSTVLATDGRKIPAVVGIKLK